MFKLKRILFSLLLSGIVVIICHFSTIYNNLIFYLSTFIGFFLCIYFGFYYLSNIRIQQLFKLSPELAEKWEDTKNPKEIAEEIYTLNQEKKQELDIFYEREMYRREFVGNVAHELKTPLFSIQGYLLTLIEGGINDESIRDKYLHRINKSVDRLNYIVSDLDLITELESGNLKLNITDFDIVTLIQDVFDLLEIKASKQSISLKFDTIYKKPIIVKGDREKIQQVIVNLVVNAIHHSHKEGDIIVSLSMADNDVKITITDKGIGIKPEEINRIFERFYRVDKSRSRAQGGSGLGLSIVKHILEAHQQKINVESTYGKGAAFYFNLSLNESNKKGV